MEKEKFLPYLELCRHYFKVVDKFSKSKLPLEDVELTIYQKDLVGAAAHLMEYSHALHASIISTCVDNMLNYSKSKYETSAPIL